MSNAYDRMLEAVSKRIDEQCNELLNKGLAVNPNSPEAQTMEKLAMMTIARNAAVEAYRVAKGIVVEEHKRLSEPRKGTTEAPPPRHAPYGKNRGQQERQNG